MMNYKNKTKDELINELQKLQHESDSVKTSYEKEITERKQAEVSLRQALEWQEAIFEGSRDSIFISDQDSHFVAVNNAACELTGYSREQLLKMRIPDIHELPDLDAYKMYHQRIFGGEEILSEAKILRSDGAKTDTEFNNRCVSIAGKLYMHTTARNITESKQAEDVFRMLSLRHEAILAAVPEIIMEVDNNKIYTWANHPGQEFFGKDVVGKEASFYFEGEQETYDKVQPLFDGVEDIFYVESWQRRYDGEKRLLAWWCQVFGKTDFDFFTGEHAQQAYKDEQTIIRTGQLLSIEEKETHHDRPDTWVSTIKLPLCDKKGSIIGTFGISRDNTERKQAEEALSESRRMLRLVLDTIPARVFWKDRDSNFLGCNISFALDSGLHSVEELIGKSDYDMGWKEHADFYRNDDRMVMDTGKPKLNFEEAQPKLDGTQIWIRTSKIPILDANGQVLGLLGTYEDITERKQAEEALDKEQYLMRSLMDNLPDHIYFKDRESRFTRINKSQAQFFGLNDSDQAVG
ncbi:MAG: PAS domain S-box protein, partial [Bacteroidia bacterium]|nr:PAS domain S-box protein [Bacteroidia bacterium]